MLKEANEVLCLRSICRELVNGGMSVVSAPQVAGLQLPKHALHEERLLLYEQSNFPSVLPDLANTDCPETRSTCRHTGIVTIGALPSSKIMLPVTKRHRSAAHATRRPALFDLKLPVVAQYR